MTTTTKGKEVWYQVQATERNAPEFWINHKPNFYDEASARAYVKDYERAAPEGVYRIRRITAEVVE